MAAAPRAMPWGVMDQAVGLHDGIFFVANHLRQR
jgi:hypothetical protein